jgi:hypothetical protein
VLGDTARSTPMLVNIQPTLVWAAGQALSTLLALDLTSVEPDDIAVRLAGCMGMQN